MFGTRRYLSGLNRYIFRQCVSVMLFITVALTATVWLAQSLRLVDLIVNRGLSIEMFLYLALLIVPRFLDIVLPIATFIAVLFVFNRLTTESELVVMRAAGLSPLTLAKPVFELAFVSFLLLMLLSAYFLPASNGDFKDLQFEIRNRFVSSLLQEGAFTTISDKLTIYVGSRNERGEIVGLLIDDEREAGHPVTLLAERGAFADVGNGSRLILVNGSRQSYDQSNGKLSILTFDRYVLDLDTMRDAPTVRFREPQERYLHELFFPPPELDEPTRHSFFVEANDRIMVPLTAFSFAAIPLACLLPGEFNRRGQLKRVLLAVVLAMSFQGFDLAVKNLEGRYAGFIAVGYLIDLLPLVIGLAVLAHRGIRFNFRWLPLAPAAAR